MEENRDYSVKRMGNQLKYSRTECTVHGALFEHFSVNEKFHENVVCDAHRLKILRMVGKTCSLVSS